MWDRGKAGNIRNSRLTYCHLGHSDFAITANIYAHLDFNSKLASAEAMTWIDSTTLAGEKETSEPINNPTLEMNTTYDSSAKDLSDFLYILLSLGISPEIIQAWLKQTDFANTNKYADSFREFSQSFAFNS